MYCSGGISRIKNDTTPLGTFRIKHKSKWEALYGNEYGRYAMVFYRDFLFHSVGYRYKGNNGSMITSFYKRMNINGSLGCIRLQLIDEKWVYDHCSIGTKITICSNNKKCPLDKPRWITVKTHHRYMWDPTDPDKRNPMYKAKAPVISISRNKTTTIQANSDDYEITNGVTAKDPRTSQDLTSKMKYIVYQIDENGNYNKISEPDGTIKITSAAKYMIKYSCTYKYCSRKTGHKSLYLSVTE